jgi:hypothetical protein
MSYQVPSSQLFVRSGQTLYTFSKGTCTRKTLKYTNTEVDVLHANQHAYPETQFWFEEQIVKQKNGIYVNTIEVVNAHKIIVDINGIKYKFKKTTYGFRLHKLNISLQFKPTELYNVYTLCNRNRCRSLKFTPQHIYDEVIFKNDQPISAISLKFDKSKYIFDFDKPEIQNISLEKENGDLFQSMQGIKYNILVNANPDDDESKFLRDIKIQGKHFHANRVHLQVTPAYKWFVRPAIGNVPRVFWKLHKKIQKIYNRYPNANIDPVKDIVYYDGKYNLRYRSYKSDSKSDKSKFISSLILMYLYNIDNDYDQLHQKIINDTKLQQIVE